MVVAVAACGDDTSSESLTSFGSASDTTSASASDAGTGMTGSTDSTVSSASDSGSSATTDASATSPGTSTTDPTTSAGPTSSSTGGDPTTDGTGGSDGGSAGGADLGDCVGLGAWTSCTMYCEAILEACTPDGCGGSTVVYYGDIDDCTGQVDGSGSSQGCSESFQMGGGNSFARCCCG